MIHYQDDRNLFSASSIVGYFGDGAEVSLDHVSLNASTPMGDEWILSSSTTTTTTNGTAVVVPKVVVRLIVINPDQDWRRGASYQWKLDNAWMVAFDSNDQNAWLHWNSNSYIDSVIQISTDDNHNTVWTCDSMEFHFEAILPSGFRRWSDPVVATNTRVVMKKVQLGMHLITTSCEEQDWRYYSPCEAGRHSSSSCEVVDGVVSSSGISSTTKWIPNSVSVWKDEQPLWKQLMLLGLTVGLIVFCLSLTWRLIQTCCHWHRTKRYEQINPSEEEDDLALDEVVEEEEENEDCDDVQ